MIRRGEEIVLDRHPAISQEIKRQCNIIVQN